MTLYNPISTYIQNIRLLIKRRLQDSQPAVAGNGLGTTDVPDRIGYIYARFPAGKAADGSALYTPPFTVRAAGAVFPNYDGADIHVAYNRNNELQVVEGNYQALDKAGIDTRSFNPLHQQSKWVYLWQIALGLCTAVATTLNDSFLVSIKRHLTYVNNVFTYFETGEAADKIDLGAYVPAVDMHCYAAVWRDTYTNAVEVTTSTAQSLFTPLDVTDLNQLTTNRPPDSVPYKAFVLANNAGTISQNAADIDLRQLLNTPTAWGFPNPTEYRERVQPDRQVMVAGSYVVTGSLEVLGSLVVMGTGGDEGGSGGAPADATYIVQTPSSGLSAEQAMSALATGIVKNTTTTGVQSIAAAGTDYTSPTGTENLSNKTITTSIFNDGTVINESGANSDTRIEGDTNANLIVVDASADAVGFGTATPSDKTIIDVVSTNRLARPLPTQTTTQRDAISSPPDAGALWNSSLNRFNYRYGSKYGTIGINTPACDVRMSLSSTNPHADNGAVTNLYFHAVETGVVWLFQTTNSQTLTPYYASDLTATALTVSRSRTVATTNGSPTITYVSGGFEIPLGLAVTGTGIPANTVITDIDAVAQTYTISNNATATNASVSLTFALLASTNYDVFLMPSLKTSESAMYPAFEAWTNATTRAVALTTQNGVLVRDGDVTRRYIGTIRIASTSQFWDSVTQRFIWNLYNQITRTLWNFDNSVSWSYTSGTIRQARASAANQVEVVVGLDVYSLIELINYGIASQNGASIGVGRDTTTAYSGGDGGTQLGMYCQAGVTSPAEFAERVPLGHHIYSMNEAGVASNTFIGAATNRQSGMRGKIWA